MTYPTLKLVHVLGVVLFLGNMIVTAAWKGLADRTRDPKIVAFSQRVVTVTDITFTTVGAGMVLASGLMLAQNFFEWWRLPWIAWGLTFFIASAAIWGAVLIPVQIMQAKMAAGFAGGGEIPARYWRLSRVWNVFGLIATVLPLINLYLMVFRPE